ncbi:MAG: hypothetical protein KKA22_16435 [Gammaproteobacteria bacterium]|nr:hypothetical protein [Gammaproteobacteria bacterium]MBU1409726.1 hypothetical protein [Gammaproteobacteria bacterium]
MRLTDTNTVDFLGLEKDTGYVVLTLVDDFDWVDDIQHLSLLQSKVNRYFDFIESGEVYEQLRETTGREVGKETPIKISILAKHEPSSEGRRFMEHLAHVAEDAGMSFSFKVIPVDGVY